LEFQRDDQADPHATRAATARRLRARFQRGGCGEAAARDLRARAGAGRRHRGRGRVRRRPLFHRRPRRPPRRPARRAPRSRRLLGRPRLPHRAQRARRRQGTAGVYLSRELWPFTRSRTGDVVLSMVEGIQQLEVYFGQYLPQLIVACLTPVLIFTFVAFIDLPVALVTLAAALVTLGAPALWHRRESRHSLARQ